MKDMVIKRAACHQRFAIVLLPSVIPIDSVCEACMLMKLTGDLCASPVVQKVNDLEAVMHAGRQ